MRASWIIGGVFSSIGCLLPAHAVEWEVIEDCPVATVWAGHPVGFALLTKGNQQVAAFYDQERRMTAAKRRLDQSSWDQVILPERLGWDSHNSVTLDVDTEGLIHLAGNMHVHPLKYYRTSHPFDIHSFEKIPTMTRGEESHVTYPKFLHGPDGELLFTYRDGKSGAGNQIFNRYHPEDRGWKRLLDTPLTDGEGQRNAYFEGPVRGPDGWFHLCWVWRETPDCATNHDLSYARSKDLVHWERSDGTPLDLPITLARSEIVDPVPEGGGLINGNAKIGFDLEKRLILSYHKFDPKGNTQVFNARLGQGKWVLYQTSEWGYRWEFGGGGAIEFEIRISPVEVDESGQLIQRYQHKHLGGGGWVLDPETLRPLRILETRSSYPKALMTLQSSFPEMQVNWAADLGESGDSAVRYVLRWETLGPNRDQPREGELPPPSELKVLKLRRTRQLVE